MLSGQRYFQSNELITFFSSSVPEDSLVIATGLPGTGKSYVLKKLAKAKGLYILRSDTIRRELLEGLDIFDERIASDEEKRNAVYQEMFERAKEKIKGARGLILDATFFREDLRLEACKIANSEKKTFVIIECVCSKEKALERITRRKGKPYESNALTESAYENNLKIFEPVDLKGIKEKFPSISILYMKINTEEEKRWMIVEIKST